MEEFRLDPKYSNIFWHQGVKVFEDGILNSQKGQVKVAHLENDVTKAMLNLFEHCSSKVLNAFLQMIGIKQAPGAFNFEFQVTDTESLRSKPVRIMLCIISASTGRGSSSSYKAMHSIPDACIYSKDTAILIEAKTQSPLIRIQIESHINHYLGTATRERTVTWEDISEKFKLIDLKGQDLFLVTQFLEFLELIGISEFNGFSEIDFAMLGALGKIPDEDFSDFKRLFHRKTDKFMALLEAEIAPIYSFKPFKSYVSRVKTNTIGTYSGFNFFDDDPSLHNNYYPNININYLNHCVDLTLNAETKPSVKCVLSCIKKKAEKLDIVLKKIQTLKILVYYKIQYQPMDHFIWNLVPGFPKSSGTFNSADILDELKIFESHWSDFKDTILYQMEAGHLKHSSDRVYTVKEIDFARKRNTRPNYVIRFGRQYPIDQVTKKKKKIVQFFKGEIVKLKPLAELILN